MGELIRETKLRLSLPLAMVAIMWAVEVINLLTHDHLSAFGIRPRTMVGLWGILFAPFLHANLAHLLANTVPFIVLGWLVALRGTRQFITVTAVVMLLGGGAV